jgi:hypothetical protein
METFEQASAHSQPGTAQVKWKKSPIRAAGVSAERRRCASWGESSGGTILTQ